MDDWWCLTRSSDQSRIRQTINAFKFTTWDGTCDFFPLPYI